MVSHGYRRHYRKVVIAKEGARRGKGGKGIYISRQIFLLFSVPGENLHPQTLCFPKQPLVAFEMVNFKSLVVAYLAAVPAISAHYVYSILTIDGQDTPDWRYSK